MPCFLKRARSGKSFNSDFGEKSAGDLGIALRLMAAALYNELNKRSTQDTINSKEGSKYHACCTTRELGMASQGVFFLPIRAKMGL